MLAEVIGGIGLFLLGMALLTDALKALSGDRLRQVLGRASATRLRALATGAGATLVLQSSTAITVVTVGLVSASLLTFQQSLGIILGANLGTTGTAWVVALVGLRFSLTTYVLPIIALGALVKIIATGRRAAVGLALAGFGLLFVGIDLLQAGMADYADRIPLLEARSGILAQLALVGIGVLLAIVLQSSSAAMATTLAAVHTGGIPLTSAAFVVIGQNIGTTLTAILAGLGGSVSARRTAAMHVLFNVGTAVVAFPFVQPMLRASAWAADAIGPSDAAFTLAVYHSVFNLAGVLLFLPLLNSMARTLERLIPDRGPRLTRQLDDAVAGEPGLAVEAIRRTLAEVTREGLRVVRSQVETPTLGKQAQRSLDAAHAALARTREFLVTLRAGPETRLDTARLEASLHALDHVENLLAKATEPVPVSQAAAEVRFGPIVTRFRDGMAAADSWLAKATWTEPWGAARDHLGPLTEVRRSLRAQVLRDAAGGSVDLKVTLGHLDALLWLDQEAHHLQRILHYLSEPPPTAPPVPAADGGQTVTA